MNSERRAVADSSSTPAGRSPSRVSWRSPLAVVRREEDLLRRTHLGIETIRNRERLAVALEVEPVELHALEPLLVTLLEIRRERRPRASAGGMSRTDGRPLAIGTGERHTPRGVRRVHHAHAARSSARSRRCRSGAVGSSVHPFPSARKREPSIIRPPQRSTHSDPSALTSARRRERVRRQRARPRSSRRSSPRRALSTVYATHRPSGEISGAPTVFTR